MTPNFAQAVDPVFLHVLDLLDRIGNDQPVSANDQRVRIRALIDQAEALVGTGVEWDLSKYALVSWIDEMLVDAAWNEREWWSNNVLEMEYFNSRACNEQFYVKAREAAALNVRDALEVFYVCVVLGFRGLYHDPLMAETTAPSLNLPPELSVWSKQVSMSIRLGQGRPPLSPPGREIQGAAPLRPYASVVWAWMGGMMAVTAGVLYFMQFRAAP